VLPGLPMRHGPSCPDRILIVVGGRLGTLVIKPLAYGICVRDVYGIGESSIGRVCEEAEALVHPQKHTGAGPMRSWG
jgi:hypothetical protein